MFTPRLSRRVLTLRTGRLHAGDASPGIACAVLDMSNRGACILVADPSEIPETFTLAIDKLAAPFRCRVVWKRKNRIGISFQTDLAAKDLAGNDTGDRQAAVPQAASLQPTP